jgi:hypothetical protein
LEIVRRNRRVGLRCDGVMVHGLGPRFICHYGCRRARPASRTGWRVGSGRGKHVSRFGCL